MSGALFHALWLLCGLGAAVFAVSVRQSWYNLATMCCGFLAATIGIDSRHVPEAVWIGVATAAVAVSLLTRPSWALPAAFATGALAGTLSALLEAQAMPRAFACAIAAALVLLSLMASEGPEFAPSAMREEALFLIATLGLLVAIASPVTSGWQSALALNIVDKSNAARGIPMWVIVLGGGSAMAGALSAFRHSRYLSRDSGRRQ